MVVNNVLRKVLVGASSYAGNKMSSDIKIVTILINMKKCFNDLEKKKKMTRHAS